MRILQVIALGLLAGCRGCGKAPVPTDSAPLDSGGPVDSAGGETGGESAVDETDIADSGLDSSPGDTGPVDTAERVGTFYFSWADAWFPGADGVVGLGDLDGDSQPSFAVWYTWAEDVPYSVAIFEGSLSGQYLSSQADLGFTTSHGFGFDGRHAYYMGGLCPVADMNGDGLDDLAMAVLEQYMGHGGSTFWATFRVYDSPLYLGMDVAGAADGAVYLDGYAGVCQSRGDPTGDGTGDIAMISGPEWDGGAWEGVALFPGPLSGRISLDQAWLVGSLDGLAPQGADIGADFDGDGVDDVLCTGRLGGHGLPLAAVFLGPIGEDRAVADADVLIGASGDIVSSRLTAAWVDDGSGDGRPDVMLGADVASDPVQSAGAVWVFRTPDIGLIQVSEADLTLVGEEEHQRVGYAVADAGDVDGDAIEDLLIGAPFEGEEDWPESGAAYLVTGAPSGTMAVSEAGQHYPEMRDIRYLGCTVSGVGDTDGDGLDEFAFAGQGMAFLLSAP
ncbi:MAG: integrin alpha [Pseudomonadota bacterium]